MAVPHPQHGVWERIAHSFDRSRTRTWPHVEAYLRALTPGSHVLDLMAGNGRHTPLIRAAGHEAIWVDWSRPAARLARTKCPDALALCADARQLPLRDATLDACIFVAGLHSLPDPSDRAACLSELRRVLRRGASAQVTVWSRDAPRFRDQGLAGEPVEAEIPWRSDGHNEARTYHLYTPAALRGELEAAGFEVLQESEVAVVSRDGADNLVATVRKP